MKIIFCFALIFLIFSCKKEQNIDVEVMNCLTSKIDKGSELNSTDFFKSLKKMEAICQDEGYLDKLNKDGYLDFLKEISSKDDDKLNLLFDNLNKQVPQFRNSSLSLVTFWYKACLFNLANSNFKSNFLQKRINQFEKLERSSFSDNQSFVSYINVVNFDNKKDRLFLLCLLYNYMFQKVSN